MAVAVTLLLGAWGAGKTTALNHWIKQRPEGERWAVLMNEAGALEVNAGRGGSDHALQVMDIAGGCACCSAQMVFQTQLVKLLRAGPWSRIIIELASQAHAAPLIDSLRSPGLRSVLRLTHVVLVLDARGLLGDVSVPLDAQILASLGAASDVILNRVEAGSGEYHALKSQLQVRAIVAPRVHGALDGQVDWDKLQGPVEVMPGAQAHPIGSGGLMMNAGSSDSALHTTVWWFPAQVRFERRKTLDALARMAALPEALHIQAIFGSAREWQSWQVQPGSAPQLEEVAWRLDHRFKVSSQVPIAASQIQTWTQAWLACLQSAAGFSL
jgi:hypothetical protein